MCRRLDSRHSECPTSHIPCSKSENPEILQIASRASVAESRADAVDPQFPVVYIPVINNKVFLIGSLKWEWGIIVSSLASCSLLSYPITCPSRHILRRSSAVLSNTALPLAKSRIPSLKAPTPPDHVPVVRHDPSLPRLDRSVQMGKESVFPTTRGDAKEGSGR